MTRFHCPLFQSNPKKKYRAIERGPSHCQKLIFIVGVPRSGTTWLWGLLSSHPDVVPLVREDFDPEKPSVVEGKRVTSETGAFLRYSEDYIQKVIAQKASANPGKVFVEKTPLHLRKLDRIMAIFPEAKVIHVLRDPRAVICSMMKSTFYPFATSLDDAILQCETCHKAIRPFLGEKNLLTVRYEALISNTAKELGGVLDFVELPKDYVQTQVAENRNTSKVAVDGVFRKGKVDSYKEELTPNQIRDIEKELKGILKAGGYLPAQKQNIVRRLLGLGHG